MNDASINRELLLVTASWHGQLLVS